MKKLAMVVLVLFAGCSASAVLNERSARSLLSAGMSKKPYMVYVNPLQQLMSRTQEDYASGADVRPGPQAIKRMLDKGMVTKLTYSLWYPKITGQFSGRIHSTFCNEDLLNTLTLESGSNSNSLRGEVSEAKCGGNVEKSSVIGTVAEDGDLNLTIGGMPFQTRGRYEEHDGKGEIKFSQFAGYSSTADFQGNSSGQRVEAKWYNYSFSPDVSKQLKNTAQGPALEVGPVDVVEVSDLHLLTETQAGCKFSWKTTLNGIGAAIMGADKASGVGWASFNKKPDGSWALGEFGL